MSQVKASLQLNADPANGKFTIVVEGLPKGEGPTGYNEAAMLAVEEGMKQWAWTAFPYAQGSDFEEILRHIKKKGRLTPHEVIIS